MATNEHANTQSRDDRLADVLENFLAAAERDGSLSRTALLEQNPDLADELVACLDTLDFIGHSLGHGPATSVLECGQQFGEYQILREIGRGGMGVVYEAFHLGLERRVALKVLSGRKFEDESYRERFLQEARTAASLHHTNIVPIFEVGELDGVCYYSMQFIAGQSLGAIVRDLRKTGQTKPRKDLTFFPPGTIVRDERADSAVDVADSEFGISASVPAASEFWSPLAGGPAGGEYFREAARLIAQAADALAHAHAHNVVHRDIKPSNLILDGGGRTWITDFGLAFRADGSGKKDGGDAVGTPAYMSPEQVRPGSPVDHRTDIYSLGATLYELLTLRPLVEGESSLAILAKIASAEPAVARSHNPLIPRDLDSIVRKAAAKRPEDRYRDAAELADDLRRFLAREPIHARRVGPIERLVLWCRREPKLAGVTTAAAALLVAMSIVSHWLILRAHARAVEARMVAVAARGVAEDGLVRATTAEATAQANLWDALYQRARATRLSFQAGRRWTVLDLIAEAQALDPDHTKYPDPAMTLRDEAIAALSIQDARLHERLDTDASVDFLAFRPTGLELACGSRTGILQLFDVERGSTPVELTREGREVQAMAFSRCGRLAATASRDGTIELWDLESHQLAAKLEAGEFRPRSFISLIFLDRPARLVVLNDGDCRQWQMDERDVRELPPHRFERFQLAAPGPGSDEITLLSATGALEIYNIVSGDRRAFAEGLSLRGRTYSMVWDSAGKVLAVGRRTGSVDLFGLGQAHAVESLGGHRGPVRAMAFNPNGTVLAASGLFDPALKLWDVRTGDQIASLSKSQPGDRAISFSPDGRYVATGSEKSIWLWEIVSPKSVRRITGHEARVTRVAIAPDGKRLVSGSLDGSVLVWPLDGDAEPREIMPKSGDAESGFNDRSCEGLSFSSDGRLLSVRSSNGVIRLWDIESWTEVANLSGGRAQGSGPPGGGGRGQGGGPPGGGAAIGGGEFIPGTHELLRSVNREIQRWSAGGDARSPVVATTKNIVTGMTVSRDGRNVAASTWGNRVEVFEIAGGTLVCAPIVLPSQTWAIALSADGDLLAAGERGNVHLFDLPAGKLIRTWQETDDRISSLNFSADGRWLAVAGRDGSVRLRAARTGEPVTRIPGHVGGAWSVVFGPDSATLATCGEDKLVQVWRLDSLNDELAELGLHW